MKKTFIIGDIHGCYASFDQLLNDIAPVAGEDRLIILGDMINRGPNSNLVLDKLIQMRLKGYEIIALQGNHELMFLNFLSGKNINFFLINGGDATINSYQIKSPYSKDALKKIPDSHVQFLKSLFPYWEDEKHIYVHAGLQPGVKLAKQQPDWLYWSRENFINQQYDYGKQVVFGHTPFEEPFIQKNKVGIDTGAVYGGKLTCLILPEYTFKSVDGLKRA
jgi:serine/threonine protein phosphatase 1